MAAQKEGQMWRRGPPIQLVFFDEFGHLENILTLSLNQAVIVTELFQILQFFNWIKHVKFQFLGDVDTETYVSITI